MSGVRGVMVGVLALTALEAVVSTDSAATRTAGLLGDVASLVSRALDPTLEAIPDRRKGKDSGGSKSSLPSPATALVPVALGADLAHTATHNPAVAGLFGPVGIAVNLLTGHGGKKKYKPTKPAS